jgi:uncharacterized protein YdeI (YjbR/CyaY-like superfamily)
MFKSAKWQVEAEMLREIALACDLDEELKWGKPCFTLEGKNIVIIQRMKESCALMFFKGVLLRDAKKLLRAPGENSQSSRWIKFASVEEIARMEKTLKAYIREAIELEKAGAKVKLKTTAELGIPEELQNKLDKNPAFMTAFRALTPGRQRAYCIYISQAKQSATREARVEKCMPQILMGKGLND